ncbi:MAG: PEP-CTERM sorting domain-containing protein [Phycisphaeraceae bacterium]|nr:PEP-CTERM sorting domain-containing protein [Phycisphaeraceae bacterium]
MVVYQDVTESSGTDPVPLYGPPTLTQNTLDFDPTTFVASSTNSINDITDGQLNFTLMAVPQAGISSFSISESGDYTLVGTGTAATEVGAGLTVFVKILEVDGVALPAPLSLSAVNASVSFNLAANGPVIGAPWSLGVGMNLDAALTNAGINYIAGVSKAEIVLDNTLVAISEANSIAFIAKKDFVINPVTVVIPEPASLMLIGGGLALLTWRGRRVNYN